VGPGEFPAGAEHEEVACNNRSTGSVTTIRAYDLHVEQLFDVIARLAGALTQAGIEYRLVGGVAVFLHVHERDPLAARSTRVDIAVDRRDLERIVEAVRQLGLEYRHAAGVDMLVDGREPKAKSAVHLIFVGERVRPDYAEPVPAFRRRRARVRVSRWLRLSIW